jgi:transcriptional regulator with XRE-family HTH domain
MKKISSDDLQQKIKDIFKKLKASGYDSDTVIAKVLGLHPLTIGTWRRGEKTPGLENLEKLEGLLESKPLTSSETISQSDNAIYHFRLPKNMVETIQDMAAKENRDLTHQVIQLLQEAIHTRRSAKDDFKERIQTLEDELNQVKEHLGGKKSIHHQSGSRSNSATG